jgi:tetratricopeptide (TPR) repeat protein
MEFKRWVSLTIRIAIALAVGIPLFRWAAGAMGHGEGLGLNFGAAFAIVGALLFYAMVLLLLFGRSIVECVANRFESLYVGHDDNFRIMPEYSTAEARVKNGKYQEAIDEYRKVILEYPDDIYPHLRIAELAVKHLNDLKLAELELLSALGKAKGQDSTALAAGRLADFYQLTVQDPARALAVMKQLREKIPGTKQAKLAEERIAVLERIAHDGVPLPKAPDKIAHRPSRYKMSE